MPCNITKGGFQEDHMPLGLRLYCCKILIIDQISFKNQPWRSPISLPFIKSWISETTPRTLWNLDCQKCNLGPFQTWPSSTKWGDFNPENIERATNMGLHSSRGRNFGTIVHHASDKYHISWNIQQNIKERSGNRLIS